jgi:hypothetical protein
LATRRFFDSRTVRTWRELTALQNWLERRRVQWLFRGQGTYAWGLQTSLERAVKNLAPKGVSRLVIEGALLRRFQRQAHHYLADVPASTSWLEWLALMQHFGAPTRLQDWTYSFFVAVHFALEEGQPSAALWILDSDWATERAQELLTPTTWNVVKQDINISRPTTFRAVFARTGRARVRFVMPVNPFRLNQRLAIQQGAFLCPGDVTTSLEANLREMLPATRRRLGVIIKVRLAFTREVRREVVRRLLRMNVTRTSLFPGLDGFAQSLSGSLVIPRTIVADPKWPTEEPLRKVHRRTHDSAV